MTADEMVYAIWEYYSRVDAGDIGGLLELFAADAIYRRPGYEQLVGRTALEDFYRHHRVIESGRHTIVTLTCGEDRVAVQGTFIGILKDGSRSEVEFADFYQFRGSVIAQRTTYFYAPQV